MRYKEYLNSEEWENKKDEAYEKYGKSCFFCGGYCQIQIHHVTYKNLFAEKDGDLIPLCGLCHHQLHKDPVFLKNFLLNVKKNQIIVDNFIL